MKNVSNISKKLLLIALLAAASGSFITAMAPKKSGEKGLFEDFNQSNVGLIPGHGYVDRAGVKWETYTVLHSAVQMGQEGVVQLLLSDARLDASIGCSRVDTYGVKWENFTALHLAIEKKNKEIIKMLCKMPVVNVGCNSTSPTGVMRTNYTALHMAVDMGDCQIVELLLREANGMNVNIGYSVLDAHGNILHGGMTPLYRVMRIDLVPCCGKFLKKQVVCNEEIAVLLMDRGAILATPAFTIASPEDTKWDDLCPVCLFGYYEKDSKAYERVNFHGDPNHHAHKLCAGLFLLASAASGSNKKCWYCYDCFS